MPRTSFIPRGRIRVEKRDAHPDERSEIRVTADYVLAWGVHGGRVHSFSLRGQATLRKLAEAILEAQRDG